MGKYQGKYKKCRERKHVEGGTVNFESTAIYVNQDNFKDVVIGLESINGEAQL